MHYLEGGDRADTRCCIVVRGGLPPPRHRAQEMADVWISHSRTEISRLVTETRRELLVRRSGVAEYNPWYTDRAGLFVCNPS